jgi:hypothetical protein
MLFPPTAHKNDETDARASGQGKTTQWLDFMMKKHCEDLANDSLMFENAVDTRTKTKKTYSYRLNRFKPLARERGRKRQKVEELTSKSSYEFTMVGMHLLNNMSEPRKLSLRIAMQAVKAGLLRPSFAFAGRQHNISVVEGCLKLMSSAMGISRNSSIAAMMKEN